MGMRRQTATKQGMTVWASGTASPVNVIVTVEFFFFLKKNK